MKISQREAHALKARVRLLEDREDRRRSCWRSDYPGGTHLGSMRVFSEVTGILRTARRLNHAVVAIESGDEVRFYGLPLEGSKA